jgi:anaerobic ribonucleoside-triphosphate reductase activating protein
VNYATIKYCDIANGAGVRTSLFVSGCTRHCKDCFNAVAWPFDYGEPFDDEVADEVVKSLDAPYVAGLSLLGGEPMEPQNQVGLVGLVERVRRERPDKTIWCYTGDVLDDVLVGGRHHTDVTDRFLSCIDVLVDGEFDTERHDISLRFRGSANQRIIDLPKTLAAGHVVGWVDDPVFSTHTV